jgi:hypothetical protein
MRVNCGSQREVSVRIGRELNLRVAALVNFRAGLSHGCLRFLSNGECAVGIAPGVTLSACRGPEQYSTAFEMLLYKLEVVDIFSNSWGPFTCQQMQTRFRRKLQECPFPPESTPCQTCGATTTFGGDELGPECKDAIKDYCFNNYEMSPDACADYLEVYVYCDFHSLNSENDEGFATIVNDGRGGKGAILVFAGGNDYTTGESLLSIKVIFSLCLDMYSFILCSFAR